AYRVLKYVLEHDLPGQAARQGEYLMQRLKGLQDRHPIITEVRGKGLLQAVQLDRDVAEEATLACLERGLIVNNVRPNAGRLAPPLTVSQEELDQAVGIIDEVLASV
ncbi:MAG: aminotransferase class III-fold pyridoxal phosphate-dependent enzyme, partial [Dehalococcoidia bacterium]